MKTQREFVGAEVFPTASAKIGPRFYFARKWIVLALISGCACANAEVVELPDQVDTESGSLRPCDADTACEDEEFCSQEHFCESVWGKEYLIGVAGLKIPIMKNDGKAWDDDGSLPDPRCTFSDQNTGKVIGLTKIVENSIAPVYEDREIIFLTRETSLRFECFDNLGEEDPESIGRGCWGEPCGGVPVQVIRDGGDTLFLGGGNGNGAEMVVEFRLFKRTFSVGGTSEDIGR